MRFNKRADLKKSIRTTSILSHLWLSRPEKLWPLFQNELSVGNGYGLEESMVFQDPPKIDQSKMFANNPL